MAASVTDTQGIIAIVAAALALAALVAIVVLSVSVRRLRRAQRTVLGEHGAQDVVAHAAAMQQAFAELHAYVGDAAARLDERLAAVETALRGRIAHRALVRYDAYNELSGKQSMSIALLDDESSGIVLSCIHHRDQARVYGKQVHRGRGELELSPEEAEAVSLALAGTSPLGDGSPAPQTSAPAGDEQPA
jgi:Protein of unknown function (DUF4446)